jgi:putative chitinase
MNQTEQNLIGWAKQFGITDKLELIHMLSQCSHESGNFTKLVESFNYSASGLMATWNSRFDTKLANELGRTQEHPAKQRQIANLVYNGRMGNRMGTDDGYDFRGRGYIQITGRENYTKFNAWLKSKNYAYDVVNHHNLIWTEELNALSAIWFWLTNNIGTLAKKDDVVAVSKKINGGTIGLAERQELTNDYKKLLNV